MLDDVLPMSGLNVALRDGLAVIAWLIAAKSRDGEYVNLSQTFFGKFVRQRTVPRLKRKLIDWEIIDCDGEYSCRSWVKPRKSFGFRLGVAAAQSGLIEYEVTAKAILKRLNKRLRRTERTENTTDDASQPLPRLRTYNLSLPVHWKLAHSLERATLDMDVVNSVIAESPAEKRPYRKAAVELFQHERRISVDDYHRVHSNVTNIKRELRRALRFDGEPLVELDIACSQPTILASLFPDEMLSQEDVRRYVELCVEGRLYDELVVLLHHPLLGNRGFVKEMVFTYFYSPPINLAAPQKPWKDPEREQHRQKKRAFAECFQTAFPNVDEFVRAAKQQSHKALPCRMQRREAEIVIETVCAELYDTVRPLDILTVHDALMVKQEVVDDAKKAIVKGFTRFTVVIPTITTSTPHST